VLRTPQRKDRSKKSVTQKWIRFRYFFNKSVPKNIKFYFVYISKRFKELLEQRTFKTYKKNFKYEMVQQNTGKETKET